MKINLKNKLKLHYAWIISFAGLLIVFSYLGLGRFAIGMLLPSMSISLDWSYSDMGLIGTGNFVGYMLAVLPASILNKKIGARLTITLGLTLVGVSMVLVSYMINFFEILFLYFLTGIGSSLASVSIMGSVSSWFGKEKAGVGAGIMMSGNGFGIVFVGLLVPWINDSFGSEGWRSSWLILGIISIFIAIISVILLRNNPKEMGLLPLGSNVNISTTKSKITRCKKFDNSIILHLGIIFLLFATTYSVYATFIITEIINERGFSEKTAGNIWMFIGALAILSGPFFGWISDKFGRRMAMIILNILFTISYALVSFDSSYYFLYLSIFIFGITAWSMPSIMAATVGDYFETSETAEILAYVILFFGLGQIIGPFLAGFMADASGNFKTAFLGCSILTSISVVIVYFLKKPLNEN